MVFQTRISSHAGKLGANQDTDTDCSSLRSTHSTVPRKVRFIIDREMTKPVFVSMMTHDVDTEGWCNLPKNGKPKNNLNTKAMQFETTSNPVAIVLKVPYFQGLTKQQNTDNEITDHQPSDSDDEQSAASTNLEDVDDQSLETISESFFDENQYAPLENNESEVNGESFDECYDKHSKIFYKHSQQQDTEREYGVDMDSVGHSDHKSSATQVIMKRQSNTNQDSTASVKAISKLKSATDGKHGKVDEDEITAYKNGMDMTRGKIGERDNIYPRNPKKTHLKYEAEIDEIAKDIEIQRGTNNGKDDRVNADEITAYKNGMDMTRGKIGECDNIYPRNPKKTHLKYEAEIDEIAKDIETGSSVRDRKHQIEITQCSTTSTDKNTASGSTNDQANGIASHSAENNHLHMGRNAQNDNKETGNQNNNGNKENDDEKRNDGTAGVQFANIKSIHEFRVSGDRVKMARMGLENGALFKAFSNQILTVAPHAVFHPSNDVTFPTPEEFDHMSEYPNSDFAHQQFFHRNVNANGTVSIKMRLMTELTTLQIKKRMLPWLKTYGVYMNSKEIEDDKEVIAAWVLGGNERITWRPDIHDKILKAITELDLTDDMQRQLSNFNASTFNFRLAPRTVYGDNVKSDTIAFIVKRPFAVFARELFGMFPKGILGEHLHLVPHGTQIELDKATYKSLLIRNNEIVSATRAIRIKYYNNDMSSVEYRPTATALPVTVKAFIEKLPILSMENTMTSEKDGQYLIVVMEENFERVRSAIGLMFYNFSEMKDPVAKATILEKYGQYPALADGPRVHGAIATTAHHLKSLLDKPGPSTKQKAKPQYQQMNFDISDDCEFPPALNNRNSSVPRRQQQKAQLKTSLRPQSYAQAARPQQSEEFSMEHDQLQEPRTTTNNNSTTLDDTTVTSGVTENQTILTGFCSQMTEQLSAFQSQVSSFRDQMLLMEIARREEEQTRREEDTRRREEDQLRREDDRRREQAAQEERREDRKEFQQLIAVILNNTQATQNKPIPQNNQTNPQMNPTQNQTQHHHQNNFQPESSPDQTTNNTEHAASPHKKGRIDDIDGIMNIEHAEEENIQMTDPPTPEQGVGHS